MQQALNIVEVVTFLSAFVALASRLFVASRPFWSRLPAFYQTFLPAIVPALATLAQGLTGVKNWGDLSVQFMVCAAMLLPGLPSNRSAAPLQAGKPLTVTPSASDAVVASAIAKKDSAFPPPSKPPSIGPMGGMLMLCLVLSMTGCGLLASAAPYLAEAGVVIADAINDIALVQELIAKFPGLSPDTRGALEKKLQAAQLALQAAAAADNGAKELTAEQLDASFAAFRAAWFDLADALAAAGIVPGAKIGGAVGGEVSLPKPLALRPVVVK